MADSLSDYLSDYDQLASETAFATMSFFQPRLKRFFHYLMNEDDNIAEHIASLRNRISIDEIRKIHLLKRDGMGDDIIRLPDDPLDQLAVYLNLFQMMSDDQKQVRDFAVQYFRGSERNFDQIISNMSQQFFQPFVAELRRYIRKNYDNDPPDIDAPAGVPASDRSVAIDHNSRDFLEAEAQIQELIELLRSTNDYDDSEERAQRIAELEAGRIVLSAPKVRASIIESVFRYCLNLLAKKFADVELVPVV